MALGRKPFENIVGKGENADKKHFLLFQQCYLPFPKQLSIFWSRFCCLQMLSTWTCPNFCCLVKGLIHILKFTTIDLFYVECRARSGCINMQSDLAMHRHETKAERKKWKMEAKSGGSAILKEVISSYEELSSRKVIFIHNVPAGFCFSIPKV